MANNFSADTHCKALWRFENGALTVDSKGNNTLSCTGVTANTTDYQEGGACGNFEATDPADYLTITDTNLDAGFPLKNGDTNKKISVCGFVKIESFASNPAYWWAKYEAVNGGRSLGLKIGGDGTIGVNKGYSNGNVYDNILTTFGAISAGVWYHIGFTYDDATRRWNFRVWNMNTNSLHGDQGNTAANTIYVNTTLVAIGARSGLTRGFFDGMIDEVVVFDDILTSAEIDQIRAGTYGAGTAFTHEVSDALGVTDSAGRYAAFSREARDTLGVTDERFIQAAFTRFLSDPLGVSDSIFRTQGHFRTASDSIGITDALSQTLFVLIYRTVTESLGITDSADRYQSVVRFLSENLGVSDATDKASDHSRFLSELLGIEDTASRMVGIIREIADTLGLTDSNLAALVAEGIAYARIITESLGITDARIQATATIAWLMIALSLQRLIHIEAAVPFCSVEAYKL